MKSKHLFSILFLLIFAFSCSSDDLEDDMQYVAPELKSGQVNSKPTVIQWDNEKQEIDGFGIAQAGWSDVLYSHHKRDDLMNLLFGKDGLNLSIVRGEIFPHYVDAQDRLNFDTGANIDLPLSDPFFDQSSDDKIRRGQLWIMREAKNTYNVDKLIFSAWTPPALWKSNQKVSKGFLLRWDYWQYAEYLAKFAKAYNSIGLPVYAISPANEPEFPAEWNSCVWLPGAATLAPFLNKFLVPVFQKEKLNTKIIIGENAQWSGLLGGIMGSDQYVARVLRESNANTKNYIAQGNIIAAGHGYPDPFSSEYKKMPIVPFTESEGMGVKTWLTEISEVTSFDASLENGIKWAADFHRYLNDANASALIWWTGAVTGNNNEGLISLGSDRNTYRMTKRYETFGNFSRYIKPGSRRIGVTRSSTLPADFHITSYKDGNKYVIVAINNTDKNVINPIEISGSHKFASMKHILTDAENKWTESEVQPSADGVYTMSVPAKSVVTLTGTIK